MRSRIKRIKSRLNSQSHRVWSSFRVYHDFIIWSRGISCVALSTVLPFWSVLTDSATCSPCSLGERFLRRGWLSSYSPIFYSCLCLSAVRVSRSAIRNHHFGRPQNTSATPLYWKAWVKLTSLDSCCDCAISYSFCWGLQLPDGRANFGCYWASSCVTIRYQSHRLMVFYWNISCNWHWDYYCNWCFWCLWWCWRCSSCCYCSFRSCCCGRI